MKDLMSLKILKNLDWNFWSSSVGFALRLARLQDNWLIRELKVQGDEAIEPHWIIVMYIGNKGADVAHK